MAKSPYFPPRQDPLRRDSESPFKRPPVLVAIMVVLLIMVVVARRVLG